MSLLPFCFFFFTSPIHEHEEQNTENYALPISTMGVYLSLRQELRIEGV